MGCTVFNKCFPILSECKFQRTVPKFSVESENLTVSKNNLQHELTNELTSLVAQTVKCLPTMWETQVQSLGWEDLLEKDMTTYSSILAWKIPWMEEPGGLQSIGSQRVRHAWVISLSLSPCHILFLGTSLNWCAFWFINWWTWNAACCITPSRFLLGVTTLSENGQGPKTNMPEVTELDH